MSKGIWIGNGSKVGEIAIKMASAPLPTKEKK